MSKLLDDLVETNLEYAKKSSNGSTTVALAFNPVHGCCGGLINPRQTISFLIPKGQILTLQDWLPSTSPKDGDNFMGVDRSIDQIRLAGYRINCRNWVMSECLDNCMALNRREGGRASLAILPKERYEALKNELGETIVNATLKAKNSTKEYAAIQYETVYGLVYAVEDDVTNGYLIDLSSWVKGETLYCTRPGHNVIMIFNDN